MKVNDNFRKVNDSFLELTDKLVNLTDNSPEMTDTYVILLIDKSKTVHFHFYHIAGQL